MDTQTHFISSISIAQFKQSQQSKQKGKKRVRKNWRVEISRTALLHLLRLPLQCWPPSAHQSCRSFPAISQSADRVRGQYFSTQWRMPYESEQISRNNMLVHLIRNCEGIHVVLTLAFWIDRPLISSLISTVDVLISAQVKGVISKRIQRSGRTRDKEQQRERHWDVDIISM